MRDKLYIRYKNLNSKYEFARTSKKVEQLKEKIIISNEVPKT